MARFHARPEGNVPFTAEEEAQRDAEELAWANRFPPPPTPNEELSTAISDAIKDEPANSPVRKLGEALLGQTGKAGRIAGRPL